VIDLLKELIYDYDEFKRRISNAYPVHYACDTRTKDRFGLLIEVRLRLYGITSYLMHPDERVIVIFEKTETINTNSKEFHDKWSGKQLSHDQQVFNEIKERYDKFIEEFGEPLKATEGRWG